MSRPDGVLVWRDKTVSRRLGWYRSVMKGQRPAKFLICKSLPCGIDLESASEEMLWLEHERLAADFKVLHERIAEGVARLEAEYPPGRSFLDLKSALLSRMLTHCNFCEWNCLVDRVRGTRKGACRMDAATTVSTWFRHFGEEAPLVGDHGSGTIFFAGCVFRCVFCQNWDISQSPGNGASVDGRKLALIMKELKGEGAHNINLVGGEPTPNLHTIVDALRHLDESVAILWNSDMYASLQAMKILGDVIDIWLPDFKYGNDKCALRLSKVVRYFETVARNHRIASENGDMIIRHLVLPNHVECCTKPVLAWISENCPRALVNIMDQYHPEYLVLAEPERYPNLMRHPSTSEMEKAYAYAEELRLVYRQVSH
jgi:putative pyruvate formate lyase activating enzyme